MDVLADFISDNETKYLNHLRTYLQEFLNPHNDQCQLHKPRLTDQKLCQELTVHAYVSYQGIIELARIIHKDFYSSKDVTESVLNEERENQIRTAFVPKTKRFFDISQLNDLERFSSGEYTNLLLKEIVKNNDRKALRYLSFFYKGLESKIHPKKQRHTWFEYLRQKELKNRNEMEFAFLRSAYEIYQKGKDKKWQWEIVNNGIGQFCAMCKKSFDIYWYRDFSDTTVSSGKGTGLLHIDYDVRRPTLTCVIAKNVEVFDRGVLRPILTLTVNGITNYVCSKKCRDRLWHLLKYPRKS